MPRSPQRCGVLAQVRTQIRHGDVEHLVTDRRDQLRVDHAQPVLAGLGSRSGRSGSGVWCLRLGNLSRGVVGDDQNWRRLHARERLLPQDAPLVGSRSSSRMTQDLGASPID
nr:hypothetical protein PDK3.073 [Rhodococcus sp. DK17]